MRKQAPHRLRCSCCGLPFDDDGFQLTCTADHRPALLVSRYSARKLQPEPSERGIYRYQCWLPGAKRLPHTARTVTYPSRALASILRLPNLWIAFSGYWPERDAVLETASFKELEVSGVLSRIRAHSLRALVVASAGNTAAAFARSCSENEIPCLIIVPESGMVKMRFSRPLHRCVRIVCLTGGATYSDAITLAEQVSHDDGFVSEGGVRNVGRRDGMGTAMLNAAETIGRLPDHYFQAIGSGAGAIAAHEAAGRLIGDSRFGLTFPRLMLSQNAPFTPIYSAWKMGHRDIAEIEDEEARSLAGQIYATVLSNRRPPYSTCGGVFDVLRKSKGEMFAVRNEDAVQATGLFESAEGIDIEPAAGVALASLMTAAASGQVDREATILLHVTGGGARRRSLDQNLLSACPDEEIGLHELGTGGAAARARRLFTKPVGRPASASGA